MGLFKKIKQSFNYDEMRAQKSERKKNMFDRAFDKLDRKMSDGFDVLEQQMDVYGVAVNNLYALTNQIHAEYPQAFTARELQLYNKVQELGERIDGMWAESEQDHRRFLSGKREDMHNALAASLACNESLPEEVRDELRQRIEEYREAEPKVFTKLDRVLSHLPGQTHEMELGGTFIQWG
ncbi:MAG: hypothetical protein IKF14_08225 [Atopobiaceae bacterium]|nr:hypothetical protein [Atopobiaceae bacterium]